METTDHDTTAGPRSRPVEPELPELEVEIPEPDVELAESGAELELPPVPRPHRERPQGMVPGRERRRTKVERASMRVLATGGIVGVDVVLGAVLVDQAVAGWIVGLVVGVTSVILAAVLWSSRQL
jgi:hypothetical protein